MKSNLNEGDFLVLGFLMFQPMTGYDLKALMDSTIGHFSRPSYGGIYPSLAKLARGGLAEVERSTSGGKLKKLYRIQPAGRKIFLTWLKVPPDITKDPGPMLSRMFFWGYADRADVTAMLGLLGHAAKERVEWLRGLREMYASRADEYQMATCQFGMDYYTFLAGWFNTWQAQR